MKINITYMVPGVESVYAINKKKKLDAKSDEKKDNSRKKNNFDSIFESEKQKNFKK